ncbi:hypothetical protein [Comamonas sp. JUb58]|uniref:hypothetical protein n=1 Tax=Comamonas sp. JUb58 TaxID=2485114 RepID=UPI00105D4E3D|nr:hypothetical protein [Comamonas sp. JUb58]
MTRVYCHRLYGSGWNGRIQLSVGIHHQLGEVDDERYVQPVQACTSDGRSQVPEWAAYLAI